MQPHAPLRPGRSPATRVAGLGRLLVLLALGTVPAAAAASELRLYGLVDLNLTRFTGGPLEVTQAATSRLGLRGREDLGDGWTAQFQLESELRPDTGTTAGRFWGRESWVGLAGRWGSGRLGRSRTPLQRLASEFDPHGTDGIGSLGTSALLLGHNGLSRFEQALYVESVAVAGWSASLAVQLDERPEDGRDDHARAWRVRGAGAGWSVSAGEAELSPGNRVASIGIAHSLGRSTVQLQAHRGERNGQRRTTQLIGATYEHGPYLLRLATSRSAERGNAAAARGLLALGADWSLSKRSALYATVARDRTGTTQARHGLELGLRHRF